MFASPLFSGFDFATVAAKSLAAGDLVVAIGHRGRIERIDAERGVLVRWVPGQGFGPGDGMFLDAEKVFPAI